MSESESESLQIMINRKIFILLCCCMCVALVQAKITVEATIDSIQIFIGQQAHVTLKVTTGYNDRLELPPFKPNTEVLPNVELLNVSQPDTSDFDGNRVVSQVYTFTSFEANNYYLPPLPVKVNGKEYKSKSLAMKVMTVDVDTTKLDQFFPPKDVQDNPFSWSDWYSVIASAALILILSLILLYIWQRKRCNKPIFSKSRIVKKLPAHERALKALGELKLSEKPNAESETNALKDYYTKLTDTLRQYIEERFGFNAKEMTTTEIVENLQSNPLLEESISELRELFQTADLVKFAKYSTLINENDMNLLNAVEFVNSTKQDEKETVEIIAPETSETDKRDMLRHRVYIIIVTTICTAVCGAYLFILYKIYDLLF